MRPGEERVAQGYDSTREASEARAAAGAKGGLGAGHRTLVGHQALVGGGSGMAREGLAGRGGSGARSAFRRAPLLGARRPA